MATPYPLPRETRQSTLLLGNGTAGPYGPTTFKVFDTADIEVWQLLTGALFWTRVTAIVVTKTAAAAFDTVSVTFPAVVASTTRFAILSRRVHERTIAVLRAGAIDADQLEKELSKQSTILQELRRDIDNGLQLPPLTGGRQVVIGDAGDTVVFDAGGNMVPGINQSDLIDLAALAADVTLKYNTIVTIYNDILNLSLAFGTDALPGHNDGRLSLSPADAAPTWDMVEGQKVYFLPYKGPKIALWNATLSRWKYTTIDPTVPLRLTVPFTGNIANGSAVISGIADTSELIAGMLVTAAGVTDGTTIVSKTATSITLSANASATGSAVQASARVPANTIFDIGVRNVGGVTRLTLAGSWTGRWIRGYDLATQDGVLVSPSDPTTRIVGTIRTSERGATEDSVRRRLVSNIDNCVARTMTIKPADFSWTHGFTGWRQVLGNAGLALEYVAATPRSVKASANLLYVTDAGEATAVPYGCGIGVNSPDSAWGGGQIHDMSTARKLAYSAPGIYSNAEADYVGSPGIGFHRLCWLEFGNADATFFAGGNFFGASLEEIAESAMVGEIWN